MNDHKAGVHVELEVTFDVESGGAEVELLSLSGETFKSLTLEKITLEVEGAELK